MIRFLLPPVDTPPCPLPICFSLLLLLPPPFLPLTVDSCDAATHQVTAASVCTTTCDNGECCAAGSDLSTDKTTCTNCDAGKTSTSGGACTSCAAGKTSASPFTACVAVPGADVPSPNKSPNNVTTDNDIFHPNGRDIVVVIMVIVAVVGAMVGCGLFAYSCLEKHELSKQTSV